MESTTATSPATKDTDRSKKDNDRSRTSSGRCSEHKGSTSISSSYATKRRQDDDDYVGHKRRRDYDDDYKDRRRRHHNDDGNSSKRSREHRSSRRHERSSHRRRHSSRDRKERNGSRRRSSSNSRKHGSSRHYSSRHESTRKSSTNSRSTTTRSSSPVPTAPARTTIIPSNTLPLTPPPPPPPPPFVPPSPPPPPPSASTLKSTSTSSTSTLSSFFPDKPKPDLNKSTTPKHALTQQTDPYYSAEQQQQQQQQQTQDHNAYEQQQLSHDQNEWHYYDGSASAWDYASQQQYEQYQSSYYTQGSDNADQSLYYAQYYNGDHSATSTTTADAADATYYAVQSDYPPPPPPPPLPPPPPPPPFDSNNPLQRDLMAPSHKSLEEIGYPYPTFEDPTILFEKIGQVGEGTYGKVYKARNCKTGKLMALKRIRMKTEKEGFPITAMREIKLLQKLKHERIVRLQEILVSKGSVYMVLEYMDHDLSGILGHPDFKFEPAHTKSLTKQILQGLAYLHQMGILHRDMKGSNLLLNKKGELKIADFGLARVFRKNLPGDYTNRVITLWYRPPELLLGATSYNTAVDIWGVGCIMLEFFTGRPIFNGTDEISQLDTIYKIMGTPTKESWPSVVDLPWYELVRPKEHFKNVFRETYTSLLTPGALQLSEALLSMDPKNRPTAADALEFDYFTSEEPVAQLPANLMEMNDDWHDFESKQRKRKQISQN